MENELVSLETVGGDGCECLAIGSAQRVSDAIDIAIDLLEDLQKVVADGPPKALRIRFGDKVVAEVPLALTAAAALAAGVAAVLLTKLAIELKHES